MKLLVVATKSEFVRTLTEALAGDGHEVVSAGSAAVALTLIETESPALILFNFPLPDCSALEFLRAVKAGRPDIEAVLIAEQANRDLMLEAIRAGACDFVEQPLSIEHVVATARRALEQRRLTLDRLARTQAEDEHYRIVGNSPAMKMVREAVARVACTNLRVLVTGESGTGKESVAYWLHRYSPRRDRPFVKLNCAAIPRDLLESELFGYERGAFSGATVAKPGRLELADTGTMLLDEVGDLEPAVQAKLLRVLESGEFERLGSTRPRKVDIRFIAATNKDLIAEIRAGRFRDDLYHRLNGFALHVPALRERRDDIPQLALHLLAQYCQENGLPPRSLSPDVIEFLVSLSFPGNVRELKNLVERAAIIAPTQEIRRAHLQIESRHCLLERDDPFARTRPLDQALDEFEKAYIERQLARFGWSVSRTAAALQVGRSRLSRRVKQLGIVRPRPERGD